MIREKIFRLHRHRSSSSYSSAATDASAHKFDFTFSNIKATQVPKGWDKIYVSLISLESGKTVCKSGKVSVKNGTCQWTETFSESLWISDINDVDEYLFKFLLATGSSKSSILGETKLNLAAYLSSESPVVVSLPLKKCNYGTVLQVEVKCLTPKTNPRDEKWKSMHAAKDENADHESIENQSETSDCTTAKSVESLSCNNVSVSPLPTDAGSRETRYSFDSMDGSVGFGRQDSIESNESSSYSSYSAHGSVRSVRSLQSHGRNQREEFRKSCHAAATLLQPHFSSSKVLKEGDDATVLELEAEARMWEQNARKLAVDIERLRDELSNHSLSMTKVNMELAASRLECQDLTQEIDHLKSALDESEMKQKAAQNLEFEELGHSNTQMEEEIRFQKEENENLSRQLNKTQESNIELILILQEMEETIEKQKIEIESLSNNKLNVCLNESKSSNCSDLETSISGISTADIHEETRPENSCISELELLNMQELQSEISVLESAFEEKIIEISIEEDLKSCVLKDFVVECNRILSEKEHEVMNLEAALLSSSPIKQLKEKVRRLEGDYNELTEENLELLYELNELRMYVSKSSKSELGQHELCIEQPMEESEKTEILQEEIADLEDMESIGKDGIFVSESSSKSVGDKMLISRSSVGSHVSYDKVNEMRLIEPENNQTELMKLLSDLQEENIYLLERVSGLEAQLRYLTDKSESNRLELQHSESRAMILENQVKRLEEENESEKVVAKEKMCEMQKKWLESEETCISLGEVNIRLQATTENLMEEYNSLQKFNVELREQKLQLQGRCMELESKARTFQDCCCKYSENMGNLRLKYSFLEEGDANVQIIEKLIVMSESVMESESKLKSIINDLDSKLEVSEGERLRLAEENSLLHMQMEKVSKLRKEVLALRVSVQETRSQHQQVEASFKSVSRDYEELKREKVFMLEKISSLQRAVSKEENCRLKKNALEDKILRLEGDLIARDALCVRDAEMKNELNQIKIVNSQLLMKVKHLENVREDLQRRVQEALGHQQKQTRQVEEICCKSTSESHDLQHPQVQILHQHRENGLAKASETNDTYKSQLESEKKSREAVSKISLLEAELQEIRERYFEMSLNYAEVEDQREQLVMKLRTLNN